MSVLSWGSLAVDVFIKEAETTLSVESGCDWVGAGTGDFELLVFLKMFLMMPNAVVSICCRSFCWNSAMLSSVIQFKIKMSAYSDDRIGGIAIDVKKWIHYFWFTAP